MNRRAQGTRRAEGTGRAERTRRAEKARRGEGKRLAGMGPLNFVLLGAAVVAIVIGYILLDRGSITAAPVLLVVGYAVLVPAGLLVGSRE